MPWTLTRIGKLIRREWQVRQALRSVQRLDSRGLKDMGLQRSNLENAVRFGRDGVVSGKEAPEALRAGSKSLRDAKDETSSNDRVRTIHRRMAESAAMLANVKRAMSITAKMNQLTFADADEVRALFSQLFQDRVDKSFLLIPPFYSAGGDEIRVGRNVFVNQNCTFYDLGGLNIGDDVMIGPNVSLITAGHPLQPSERRVGTIGKPIVIGKNVWIAANAIVIGGVTIGENSVVAAGAVVTKDVPPSVLVAGNPARIIRWLEGD